MPPGYTGPKKEIEVVTGEVSTKLTEDDTGFILDKCLDSKHRNDHRIILFIQSYLVNRDAKESARIAGLEPRHGAHIRRRSDIAEAIRQLTEKALMKYGYDAADVVERVKEMADIDPLDYTNEDGSFKQFDKMEPHVRRAIKSFEIKETWDTDPNGMKVVSGRVIKIQLHDKMKANELLGREKDVFKETTVVQHDITRNMATTLLDSSSRAEQRLKALAAARDVTPAIAAPAPPDDVIDV